MAESPEAYRMPPDHIPRTRKEIEESLNYGIMRTGDAALSTENMAEAVTSNLAAVAEVLLDVRELLAEIAVGISEIRANTARPDFIQVPDMFGRPLVIDTRAPGGEGPKI